MDKKQANGLKTMVKWGECDASHALKLLKQKSSQSGYMSKSLYNWLKRKGAKDG
jgi:hypothetical protein